MIEVKFNKTVPTDSLIADILATFPELANDREKIKLIAPTGECPENYTLQIDALVPRGKVIEIVRAQNKKKLSVIEEEDEEGEEKLVQILKMASKIRGADKAIEAALGIMGIIDETITNAGEEILGSVSLLETALEKIKSDILTLNAGVSQHTLSLEKNTEANTKLERDVKKLQTQANRNESSTTALNVKVTALLTLFAQVGDGAKAQQKS